MVDMPMVSVPLRNDDDGAIRVGNTRVLLELVIYQFNQGETPEGIVESYPSLKLSDVYAVIAYYLTHREELDACMRWVEKEGQRIRHTIEANYMADTLALRARLRERLEAQKPTL